MNIEEKTAGELVAGDYRIAAVLEHYQIDFCCHGKRKIKEIVSDKDLNLEELTAEIEKATEQGIADQNDFRTWPLDLLSEYIIRTHHKYAEKQIEVIKPYLEKISQVHGKHHPELFEIKDIFNKVAGEIVMHQRKEELMILPFIKRMVKAKEDNKPFQHNPAKTVEDPLNMLREEHDIQGDSFKNISRLTNHYQTPEDGCNTYKLTLNLIREFELDLHKHIHLENNILFPKALELEKELTGKKQ